tara:strand:+ start:633 stop:902 length:270 start_codon:yes stop_codon:yes gene_type:complete
MTTTNKKMEAQIARVAKSVAAAFCATYADPVDEQDEFMDVLISALSTNHLSAGDHTIVDCFVLAFEECRSGGITFLTESPKENDATLPM